MKAIIGLGNPGKEYEMTKHNVGFMAIDSFCTKNGIEFKEKYNSFYAQTTINNEKVLFIKPLTFMNNSGIAIKKFIDFYKINYDNVLVIYDDISFNIGKIKIKKQGSSGGHNGIKSIIENLKTENFARIKIGIGKNNITLSDYVLSKFSNEELNTLKNTFDRTNIIISDFLSLNIDNLMTKHNTNI